MRELLSCCVALLRGPSLLLPSSSDPDLSPAARRNSPASVICPSPWPRAHSAALICLQSLYRGSKKLPGVCCTC